jgi:hypothetical protein
MCCGPVRLTAVALNGLCYDCDAFAVDQTIRSGLPQFF